MSVETLSVSAILKWLWVPILGMFTYLFKRQSNTFSKAETNELIDLKITPILVELRHQEDSRKENTQALKDLTEAVIRLESKREE